MAQLIILVSIGLLFLQAPAVLSYAPLLYSDATEYVRQMSDPDVIPVKYDGEGVKVDLSLSLIDISDVDTEKNQMEIICWLQMIWNNPALVWTPHQYLNVTEIRLPSSYLWTPDFSIYNAVRKTESLSPEIAVVQNDGTVLLVPQFRLRFLCNLKDLGSSSGVTCQMKLGSWTYNGILLDITGPRIDLSDYVGSAKYELVSATAERKVMIYPCCPEPYVHALFNITIRKRENEGFSSLFEWN